METNTDIGEENLFKAVKDFRNLIAERDRLRDLAAVTYAALGAECNLPEQWLDVLLAASEGKEFNTKNLLPFKHTAPEPKEPEVPAYTPPPQSLKDVVNRFLGWKLPQDFHPDAGVTFTKPFTPHGWPTGTNLFHAGQTENMLRYILTGFLDQFYDAVISYKSEAQVNLKAYEGYPHRQAVWKAQLEEAERLLALIEAFKA